MDDHRRLAVPRSASLLASHDVASRWFAVAYRLAMIGLIGLLGLFILAFLSVVVLLRLSHALNGGQPAVEQRTGCVYIWRVQRSSRHANSSERGRPSPWRPPERGVCNGTRSIYSDL
jgi:hypothetical protein